MRDFDKDTFQKQLNELADTGTDRWAEIAAAVKEPAPAPLPWWSPRRTPMRVLAACCCLVLVISGVLLLSDRLSPSADKSTGNSTHLPDADLGENEDVSDSVGTPDGGTDDNKDKFSGALQDSVDGVTTTTNKNNGTTHGYTTLQNSLHGTGSSTSQSGATVTDTTQTVHTDNGNALEGQGSWTVTTTTTTLPDLTSKEWSVRRQTVKGSGVVRWRDTASFGRIVTASAAIRNTLGTYGVRLQKRVLVSVTPTGNGSANGITALLYAADGTVLWQAQTDRFGTAPLFFGGKTPVSVELRQGDTVLGKYPFDGTVGEASFMLSPAQTDGAKRLDLMIVAETAPRTKEAVSALAGDLSRIVRAVGGSVNTGAVRYGSAVENIAFSTGTNGTAGFLRNADFPEKATSAPALVQALQRAAQAEWRPEAAKVLVLAADRVPSLSQEEAETMSRALSALAAQGVRIVPLVPAESNDTSEQVLRAVAYGTGGDYLFYANGGKSGTLTAQKTDAALIAVLKETLS